MIGFIKNLLGHKEVAVKSAARELYDELSGEFYTQRKNGWERRDLGEGMAVISELVVNYWKQRFLLDTHAHWACEFMNEDLQLLTIRDEDIDWDSLKSLSPDMMDKVRSRDAYFPTMIRRFRGDMAELEWQINPDGRYYMDEDGYGMTDDVEVALVGKIDRRGCIVEKMHYMP